MTTRTRKPHVKSNARKALVDYFNRVHYGDEFTIKGIAKAIGKDRTHVTNTIVGLLNEGFIKQTNEPAQKNREFKVTANNLTRARKFVAEANLSDVPRGFTKNKRSATTGSVLEGVTVSAPVTVGSGGGLVRNVTVTSSAPTFTAASNTLANTNGVADVVAEIRALNAKVDKIIDRL